MLKKFVTLMMVVSIFTVSAHATTQSGLKTAFDELNYSMTVEWDQKDRAVYTQNLKKFTDVVRDLQGKGLTNAQLIEFVKTEVKNEKVARDLETAFNMVTLNKMTSDEAAQYMMDTMKRSYSSGANWAGDVLLYAGVALLIVAAALALSTSVRGGAACSYGVYTCDSVCYDDYYGYTCYDDCYCY